VVIGHLPARLEPGSWASPGLSSSTETHRKPTVPVTLRQHKSATGLLRGSISPTLDAVLLHIALGQGGHRTPGSGLALPGRIGQLSLFPLFGPSGAWQWPRYGTGWLPVLVTGNGSGTQGNT
jgi:hypothetical protein